MRIKLRAIFILVAIAAVISAWLIQRTKPLPFCALVQIVDPVPSNRSTNVRNIDFENTFYLLLIKELTDEHPKTLKGMSDPNSRLRSPTRIRDSHAGMNNTRNVNQHWLLLGTMYGPLIGHALGKVVVGARRKFRDDTTDVFWYAVYGVLIGLALAVIAELLSRSERHATYLLDQIYSVLWWFLPVAVILYVIIVPAITVAR